MSFLTRIGIALDSELLKQFDRSIKKRGYTNRSEAFRDLIRDRLVGERASDSNAAVVGSVTLIYDHHASGLPQKLMNLQHEYHSLVVSTTHAHLDHDSCLEVLIVHGRSSEVQRFADHLVGMKGVQHGRLVMTVPAEELGGDSHQHYPHSHDSHA